MDASEYIEAVTGQMRCKRARAMVAKELSHHIEDQTADYLEAGMPLAEAKAEAVRQMGDAVEVGMEMDAIHRPRMDKGTLIIVGILSVAACILQTVVVFVQRANGNQFVSMRMVPFQVLVGVIIMLVILYSDYTLLAKGFGLLKTPLAVLVVMFLVLAVDDEVGMLKGNLNNRLSQYFVLALVPPLYAAVVNHFRSKRWKGLLCCSMLLLWLFWAVQSIQHNTFQTGILVFICLVVLTKALAKGWYGIPRVPALAALWGVIGGGFVAFIGYFFVFGQEYQKARLQALLHFWDKGAELEVDYITFGIRESLNSISLWGRGSGWEPVGVMKPSSDMSFYIILNRVGLIPALLIVLGLVLLLSGMLAGISKQKNVLGNLVGTACMLGLFLPALWHVAANLSLIPYAQVLMPFVYPGWFANAVSYTLLGFYLSVYRNTDVVA